MMKIIIPLLALLSNFHLSPTPRNEETSHARYIISMTGIDSLQLGMSKASLEKMLGTNFTLKHINVDGGPYDTFSTRYKGMDMTIYLNEGDDETIAKLFGLQTSHPACHTVSGITTGTDKSKVIDSYRNHVKYVAPEYENYPIRSKTKSAVAVMDTIGNTALIFHIVNRKVSSIELSSYYEFY